MMKRLNKGFTLVEIMVVIAIMAILGAIAAPNLRGFMAQKRLKGAARQVMSDMMWARMQAVSQNNRFKVTFVNSSQYSIVDDNNNNGTADTGETVVTKDIHPDYQDVSLSANGAVVFFPGGNAFGATFTLSNSMGSKGVVVGSTGRVKIQ
jgi:type IV fimbrial biogenesis protein FimT